MQVRRGKKGKSGTLSGTIIIFKACAFRHQDDVGRSTASMLLCRSGI